MRKFLSLDSSGSSFFLDKCQFAFGAIGVTAGSWLRRQFSDFVAIEILWRRAYYQLFHSSNLQKSFVIIKSKKNVPLWFGLRGKQICVRELAILDF